MSLLKLALEPDALEALRERAMRERRSPRAEAQVLLRRSLGLPMIFDSGVPSADDAGDRTRRHET
jgi:hypothetical protein